jgi:hypothetical protein
MIKNPKLTLDEIMKKLNNIETRLKKMEKEEQIDIEIPNQKVNKDGIPIGTLLIGTTEKTACTTRVGEDGRYYVEGTPFNSLSAAAAGAGAPERKSGWRFWKTIEGKRVKEVYRRKRNV